MLYGTTYYGGSGSCADGCGTVFSLDPITGGEKVLYSFQYNGADGTQPYAGLTNIGSKLYGTTVYGAVTARAPYIRSISPLVPRGYFIRSTTKSATAPTPRPDLSL